jgi:hypothetical protein
MMVTVLFVTVVPAVIFSVADPMHMNARCGIVAGNQWE